jgi:thymidylate kinase
MIINKFAEDLLRRFFDNLKNQNLKYVVLRNYELLPEVNDSKDVDIAVAPKDLSRVVNLLKKAAIDNNYQLIWKNKLDYLEGFIFVKIDGNDIYSIKLDIFNGFEWRGCSYLNHDFILDEAEEYKGFKVPLKAHEAFIMIIYYVLYAKSIRTKYHEAIYINATENIDEFRKIVKLTFNQKLSSKIVKLVTSNKISELVSLRSEISKETIRYNFKNKKILSSFAEHLKIEYWDRNKFGVMIAFSGPDGAGKSALVDPVMELFYTLGINESKVPHHLLTSNIPSLHKLPGVPKKYAKQDYTKPYQAKTSGLLSSVARTGYYFFAFLFDRLIYIKKELRENKIVIFDRYYTDIVADPIRIRIGLKKSLVQKIFALLPTPDMTFIILADKGQILSRKDELSEEKLVELLDSYASLEDLIPNCAVRKNTGTITEGKSMIFQNVFDALEERYRQS